MGMFDYVSVPKMNCRKCGEPLKDWQSKDKECLMNTIPYWECETFYTSCVKCRAWHEFQYKNKREIPLTDFRLMVGKNYWDNMVEFPVELQPDDSDDHMHNALIANSQSGKSNE